MKYDIKENGDGLEIEVSDVTDKKEQLLQSFQQCSEGKCSCRTDEYKKLESLEIEQSVDGVKLKLKSKNGEKFDISEINKCLIQTEKNIG